MNRQTDKETDRQTDTEGKKEDASGKKPRVRASAVLAAGMRIDEGHRGNCDKEVMEKPNIGKSIYKFI